MYGMSFANMPQQGTPGHARHASQPQWDGGNAQTSRQQQHRRSTTMPWISPTSPLSPRSGTRQHRSQTMDTPVMSISYIMALMDGASGTVPLTHQHPISSLLRADAPHFLRAVPGLVAAYAASLTSGATLSSLRAFYEAVLYLVLSLLQVQVVLATIPLWLSLPGVAVLPVLVLHVAAIWLLIRLVNRQDRVFTCRWKGSQHAMDAGGENSTWMLVGGLEWSEDHLRTRTLPRLADLFGQDMQAILPYRLGLPLDLAALYLQRTLKLPTATSTTLYNHVRATCVRNESKQMNVLVHNTGALDMAWVMSRLCADLPPGQQLGKFHVYTFGAATAEMTMPVGSHTGHEGHSCDCDDFAEYPYVSHYAFEDDPFARIGVLMGARQRMEGRLVGSVYAMQTPPAASAANPFRPRRARALHYGMDHYLDALFPGGDPRAGALGQVCRIERDVSEMRELAALAQAVSDQTKKGGNRLSWTALGALADNPSNCRNERNEMSGIVSLEEARRIGRALEGLRGYQNNPLASYVTGKYRLSAGELTGRMRIGQATESEIR